MRCCEEMERRGDERRSDFRLRRGSLSSSGERLEDWGHLGCSHPAEDVSTYRGCEPCQPAAPCCQLARPPLHIERPAEHRGAPEPVNHLCPRSVLPTRLFDTLSGAKREEI